MSTQFSLRYFIEQYLPQHPLFFSFIRPQEARLFYEYRKYIKAPVLDFGSGDGFFAQTVFQNKKLDVGLDIKTERTQEAQEIPVYKKVVYYDGTTIPLSAHQYETVISNCVLEHIPDLLSSLKEINKILKPQGYFVTTVMTDKWEEYQVGVKILGKTYARFMQKRQVHHNLLSTAQWREMFKKAGFGVVKEIGYLDKRNAFWLDCAHYLSIPSLITRLLFKKWVMFPRVYEWLKTSAWVEHHISLPVPAEESAAVFYVLQKS